MAYNTIGLPPPPPFVQAAVDDQKLTEPTPGVAQTWALPVRRTVHGTRAIVVCCSESQGETCCKCHHCRMECLDTKYEHHAPQIRTYGSTWHTVGPITNYTAKTHGAKIDGTNACLDTGVACAGGGGVCTLGSLGAVAPCATVVALIVALCAALLQCLGGGGGR